MRIQSTHTEVNEGLDGVLNVNKPTGWTSHDVVLKIRHIIRESKVGHTGTLDPLATGVLLVCIGKATKIAQYLTREEKEYVASLTLGITTDTLDADGTVLKERTVDVTGSDFEDVLSSFQGEIEQTPPMYSAVKHAGRRLYELARSGERVDRAPRKVHIFGIDLLDHSNHEVTLRIRCSKGTYIRSLASDIGEKLGCGAHIRALQRTVVGRFRIEDSLTMEDIGRLSGRGDLCEHVLSINEALASLPEVRVGEEEGRRIGNGVSVAWNDDSQEHPWNPEQKTIRIVGSDNTLLGLGTITYSKSQETYDLKPIRVLV